jgi:hypothetical protein
MMTDIPRPKSNKRRQAVKQQPDSRDRDRTAPSEEEIRRRAYDLYEQRGGEPGRDKEDWERAKRELRGEE